MRCISLLVTVTLLLLGGCKYEAPLVKAHAIPIDVSVLGVWEPQTDNREPPGADERMMILMYSDTEYVVHYPPGGNDETYFRGYPIRIGGISCVQLQVIGTKDGPPKGDVKERFHVVSYELKEGILEIRTLNTDLVDDNLESTEALVKAFLSHKDNKNLFTNPVRFRQIEG